MKKLFMILILGIFSFGCGTEGPTPLESKPSFFGAVQDLGRAALMADMKRDYFEIKDYQIRSYDINDAEIVMKAMTKVLSDEGFDVTPVSPGVAKAKKQVLNEAGAEKYSALLDVKIKPKSARDTYIEAVLNANAYKSAIRAVVDFTVKEYGEVNHLVKTSRHVEKPEYYNTYFSKVYQALIKKK
jgi:hypothetical protein